jgi:hypothetical protein
MIDDPSVEASLKLKRRPRVFNWYDVFRPKEDWTCCAKLEYRAEQQYKGSQRDCD